MYDDNERGRNGRISPRGPRFGGGREHHGPGGQGSDSHDERPGRGRGHGGPSGRGRGGFGGGFGGPGFGAGFGGPGFAPGFGFGREGRRARRGDVRLAILSLLGDSAAEGSEPMNGYALIKSIAERTGGAWRPSPGSVYPTLQQLVDEGLIVASGDDGRSTYALTDAGRAEVEARADDIAAAWNSTPGATDAQQGFVESLQKLFGVLHMYRTTATDAQRNAATEKLDQLRRDLLQILAD
nr:PadR family transcriptional regulator [Curtobacterium sp. Leaf261]